EPGNVRMAPNNPACSARRVEKYPVESPSIPPAGGVGRIGDADFSPPPKAAQILGNALRADRIRFDRSHLDIREFEKVCGLSAPCGACIEHAHTRHSVEPRRR